MRVLVLLPTTAALNRILRLEARPDLPASGVYAQGDYRQLPITNDYNDLTSKAGPLGALAPPVKSGSHRLFLARSIETGKSWELPVLLAHLVVAFGAELAAGPGDADLVLWSTGAVDLDLHIVDHDYRIAAKAERSRDLLTEAAAAGRPIMVFVPKCEDAAPLRDVLANVGAENARVEIVAGVGGARSVVEQALGRAPHVDPSLVRWRRRIPALIAAVAAMVFAFVATSYVLISVDKKSSEGSFSGFVNEMKRPEARQVFRGPIPFLNEVKGADTQSATNGGPPEGQSGQSPAVPPVPLQLVELRDPKGGTCFGVVRDGVPPRRIEVAVERNRFHDSVGANLCGLEWTLKNLEAAQDGIQGFAIDLPAERYGARMTGIGASGIWTKVLILFTWQFTKSITYKVNLKFAGTPPSQKTLQFEHTIR